VTVGAGASVRRSVLASGARIAPGESVEDRVVIPERRLATRPAGSRLRAGHYHVELR
jgi:hypothetical protein